MTNYELLQKEVFGDRVVGTVAAGTMAQAQRKLYRAHSVPAGQAGALGYRVQPAKQPAKAASHV